MTRPWERARDLDRGKEEFRDTRLIVVACDDSYAPKQYFDFFRIPRVQVKVLPADDGLSHASHVLDRLRKFRGNGDFAEDDQFWLLLDTDHCLKGSHKGSFIRALKEAKQEGFHLALSKPCFELWLLLHHLRPDQIPAECNARDLESQLNEVLNGLYNKTRLRKAHWNDEGVCQAFRGAKEIDATIKNSFDPERNSSQVYALWESILELTNRTQLPECLRDLVD